MDIAESQDLTLFIPLAPIELEDLVAEGLSQCRASAEDLRAGSELIQELAPVLREIEKNSSLEGYQYAMQLIRPKKGWDRGYWRWVERDTVRFLTDAVIATESPEVLAREGYAVAVDDTTNRYLAPGPVTVASESFSSTKCISISPSDTSQYVRLAFEPKETDTNLEVEGVLWIDVRGGHPIPRRLEFTYVNAGPHLEERQVPWLVAWIESRNNRFRRARVAPVDTEVHECGGFLVFREVTDGLLVITEWQVDQLALGHRTLFGGRSGPYVEPFMSRLPTHGRLLALVPRGG
jgi:hypothetical protein